MNSTRLSQVVIASAAVGALVVSIYNATQINQVHLIVNSRLSELLVLTRSASKAEGVKQEKDRQQADEKEGK